MQNERQGESMEQVQKAESKVEDIRPQKVVGWQGLEVGGGWWVVVAGKWVVLNKKC